MVRRTFGLLCCLGIALTAQAQTSAEKFSIFLAGSGEADAVVQSLSKLLNASKPFAVAKTRDDSKAVLVIKCVDRQKDQPFVCMYMLSYIGVTFSSPVGAGISLNMTADGMANALLSDMASDIVERWNDTDQEYLKNELLTCLFLSESSCAVPDPLQKSLGVKTITLREYLTTKK